MRNLGGVLVILSIGVFGASFFAVWSSTLLALKMVATSFGIGFAGVICVGIATVFDENKKGKQ
jgi:hypothetical protein